MTVLIDQLDVNMTRSQYATILALIMDNFAEPWSVCPPVIEWPKRDPNVDKGVCRDPLEGRRTAQVSGNDLFIVSLFPFCAMPFGSVSYRPVWFRAIVRFSAMPSRLVRRSVPCHAVGCRVMLFGSVLCHAVLFGLVPCCSVIVHFFHIFPETRRGDSSQDLLYT